MLYNARSRSNKKSTPIIPNSKALRYQERWKSSSHPPNTQPRSNKEPTLVLTPIIPPIRKLRDTKRVENHHVQILNPDSTKSQPPSNLHRSHSKSPSQTSKNDVQSSWWYAINIFRKDVMIRVSYRGIIIRGWQRERERRVSLRLRSEFRVIGEKWMQRGVDCEGWMKNDVWHADTRIDWSRSEDEVSFGSRRVAGTSDVVKGGGWLERVYSSAAHSKRCTG